MTRDDLLTAAEEIDLARAVEAGLYARWLQTQGDGRPGLGDVVAEGERAWQRMVLANQGMVVLLARRYCRGRREVLEELVQEGNIALAEALMRYDWSRGVRLSTQAWHWVRHHLTAVMRRQSGWERATSTLLGDEALPLPVDTAEEGPDPSLLLALLPRVERAVLIARAEGRPLRVVAQELGMGPGTVGEVEKRARRRARRLHRELQAA